MYACDQTHFSIARALDELGFPPETLVVLPADDDFRLRGDARRRGDRARPGGRAAAVRDRRGRGLDEHRSVDAIGELADVAEAEGLWLHVDAAYGGGARLSARDRGRVPDLDRADSVTVDPHKWFFQAYDIGGLLVRDGRALGEAFGGRRPEYYRGGETGAGGDARRRARRRTHDGHGDQLNFYKLAFEGTRRWRALKLWLSWKHLGHDGFGRLVEANDDLAAHLAAPVRRVRRLRGPAGRAGAVGRVLPAPAGGLSIGEALDAHQDRLQAALEAYGDGWLSTTRLRGATCLRAGIVNYLATEADVDRLLGTLRRLAG